jgi:hypothetical protein
VLGLAAVGPDEYRSRLAAFLESIQATSAGRAGVAPADAAAPASV